VVSAGRLDRIVASVAASFAMEGQILAQAEIDEARHLTLGTINFDEYLHRTRLG
jgi:hypothetical protein